MTVFSVEIAQYRGNLSKFIGTILLNADYSILW